MQISATIPLLFVSGRSANINLTLKVLVPVQVVDSEEGWCLHVFTLSSNL